MVDKDPSCLVSKLIDQDGSVVWEGFTSVAKMNKEVDEFVRSPEFKTLKRSPK